jgi:hypothetical protein
MIRYNTTISLAEIYTANGWTAIDAPPTVGSISGIINQDINTTITVTGTNFKSTSYVQIEGAGVSGVPRVLSTTYVNSTSLTAATAAASVNYVGGASFDVKVVNPSGLTGVLTAAGSIDREPIWSTSAGSLGSFNGGSSANITLSATDPDGQAIQYTVVSGSLPSGLSLSTSGVITGTFPDTTGTSSFTVRASSNTVYADRAFSIATVKRLLAVNGTTYYNTGSTQTVTLSSAGTVYPITVYSAHNLTVSLAGAQGGSVYDGTNLTSGYGGYVQGTYASIPAGTYYAVVGKRPNSNVGGYPGGGGGYPTTSNNGGGGFSGFWSGTSDPLNTGNRSTYYLIGGGGGGHSSDTGAGTNGLGASRGGDAGYPSGSNGNTNNTSMQIPGGGTQSSGGSAGVSTDAGTQGAGAGSAFYGGSAGICPDNTGQGGSGGGGWYGGGGGNSHCGQGGGAGGGGSSYYNSSYISNFTYSNGARGGDGYVTLAIG